MSGLQVERSLQRFGLGLPVFLTFARPVKIKDKTALNPCSSYVAILIIEPKTLISPRPETFPRCFQVPLEALKAKMKEQPWLKQELEGGGSGIRHGEFVPGLRGILKQCRV